MPSKQRLDWLCRFMLSGPPGLPWTIRHVTEEKKEKLRRAIGKLQSLLKTRHDYDVAYAGVVLGNLFTLLATDHERVASEAFNARFRLDLSNQSKVSRMLAAKVKNESCSPRGRIIPRKKLSDALMLYRRHKEDGIKDPAGKAAKAYGMSRTTLLQFARTN